MRRIGTSATLTVYHDGQFWVGIYERVANGRYSVRRIIFGAEPSNEEILQLICRGLDKLPLTETSADNKQPELAANPKRRQREVAKELRNQGASTKAQATLQEEREALAWQRKANAREHRDAHKQMQYDLRRQKQKRRHRGK